MNRRTFCGTALTALVASRLTAADGQNPFHSVADEVNPKLVKLFGSGGFRGLNSYGTGIIVSPEGYVLTVASPMLDTRDLRVHLWDGQRMPGKVLATEPDLDLALVQILPKSKDEKLDLPFFDLEKEAARKPAEPGDWVLAFSNQFQIATRGEPMSVQRGVIASFGRLTRRKGVTESPYQGAVYVVDAITNNPGAAGGALTTRKGELLGIIGKEVRNTLTETWVNYAVPLTARAEVSLEGGKKKEITLLEFVKLARDGKYNLGPREVKTKGIGGFTGIVLVPSPVALTPAYIEDVLPASPAAAAGLKPDDLIVYFDGEQVTSVQSYKELVAKTQPGQTVRIEVRRGDRLQSVELKLAQHPKAATKVQP